MKPKKNEGKQDFLARCTKQKMGEGATDKDAYAMCEISYNNEMSLREPLVMTTPVVLEDLGEGKNKPRKFMLTAYTGAEIKRYYYSIIFDVEGINYDAKLPILREHMRDKIVGAGQPWTENGKVFVKGQFSESTRDGKEVLALADEGVPFQASMGVWPLKVKVLDSDKESEIVNGQEITGPAEIWLESDMREVSFVALGADKDTAAISLNSGGDAVPVDLTFNSFIKEERNMELTLSLLEKEAPELLSEIRKVATETAFAEGVNTERNRCVEILDADGDPAVTLTSVKEGTPIAEVHKNLYLALKDQKKTELKDLETSATTSTGQEEPETKTETKDDRNPDVIVSERAMTLANEKGVSFEAATDQVLAADPELAKRYKDTFVT